MKALVFPHLAGTTTVVNLTGGTEEPIGSSFRSTAQALFVKNLVWRLFSAGVCSTLPSDFSPGQWCRVLIVSMYAEDVAQLRVMMDALPDAAVPKGDIDIRTVDGAQGSEADIVIATLPRSSKPGLTTDAPRLNVALSRASFLNVIVLNTDCVSELSQGDSSRVIVNSLIEFASGRGGYIQINGEAWKAVGACGTCQIPHRSRCPALRCHICHKHHHTWNCQNRSAVPMDEVELSIELLPSIANVAPLMSHAALHTSNRSRRKTHRDRRGVQEHGPDTVAPIESRRKDIPALKGSGRRATAKAMRASAHRRQREENQKQKLADVTVETPSDLINVAERNASIEDAAEGEDQIAQDQTEKKAAEEEERACEEEHGDCDGPVF